MTLRVALGVAAGFLAGVLLVAILGGAQPAGPTATVTVTTPGVGGSDSGGGTVITKTVVPDLRGQPLDVALERLARAGFEADVEGGGLFGVIDESNWEVVSQDPSGGFHEQGSSVRLDVDRR